MVEGKRTRDTRARASDALGTSERGIQTHSEHPSAGFRGLQVPPNIRPTFALAYSHMKDVFVIK
jgi:hypothetical protein